MVLYAPEQPTLMLVLDRSGSMRAQSDGEAKITLARHALTQGQEEATPQMQADQFTHGHRQRGPCSYVEVMLPMGPGIQTVAQVIAAADAMNLRGMIPISDAVTLATQAMANARPDQRTLAGRAGLIMSRGQDLCSCLTGQCLTLGPCPATDWSAREVARGLAARVGVTAKVRG
jgi:hypothetical protein